MANKKHTRAVPAMALTLILGMGACIDDPTLVDDDPIPLSRAEAELLGLEVLRDFLEIAFSVDPQAAAEASAAAVGPAAAIFTFDQSSDTTFTCELGGTIDSHLEVSGTVDDVTNEAELLAVVVQTHRGCVAGEGDQLFTIDGLPNLTATFAFSLDGTGGVALEGSFEGAITASAGGRSGICVADVHFSGSVDSTGEDQFTVGGTMCGAAVDESGAIL